MKTIIKVSKEIQEVETSMGAKKCVEGKLVLITEGMSPYDRAANSDEIVIEDMYYKPIIISETEKEKDGHALVYDAVSEQILREPYIDSDCYKILALPEHFTNKQLQAIVDGKLKDGDKVIVEVEGHGFEWDFNNNKYVNITIIKQPLTLHKSEESWGNIVNEFKEWARRNNKNIKDSFAFSGFLANKYHPPKRK